MKTIKNQQCPTKHTGHLAVDGLRARTVTDAIKIKEEEEIELNMVGNMDIQPQLNVESNIYAGAFPRFDRPKIIGYIGLENLMFAKRVYEGKVRFDLNLLYEKAIHKPVDQDVKLTELLKFLLENEQRLNYTLETSLDMSQIFCYRGLLTCVACTPYENHEPWKIVAVLFKGNIFLCARDTKEKLQRKRNMSDKEKLFTSWGFKFEQYMLSDKPDSEPNPNEPLNETEEFSLVFTTKLKNHRIVYGAEMDGIRCDKEQVLTPPSQDLGAEAIIDYLSTKNFIELKTSRHIEHYNQERNFRRFKTKKWWCQSFLAGVESILCGLRNDNGIVEELKMFSIKELPKHRLSRNVWDPNVCFNFLENFFTYVKRCLARKIRRLHGDRALNNLQALPMIDIMFEWNPDMPVVVDENYVYEDDPVLHDWFIQNYGKNNR